VAAHGAGAAGVGDDDDDTSLVVSASKSTDGAENLKGDSPMLYRNTEPDLSEKTAKRPEHTAVGSRSNIRPNGHVKFPFNETKTFIETRSQASPSTSPAFQLPHEFPIALSTAFPLCFLDTVEKKPANGP